MEESAEKLWQVIGGRLDGVKKLISVSEEPAVGKFENYASDLKRLTLRILTEDGSEETMSLIQKSKKTVFIKDSGDFETESMWYSDLQNEMENLSGKYLNVRMQMWPKCFGVRENDIFLEDLKALDYRLCPLHKSLDISHASLAIKALAKFHALGLVLIERKIFNPSKLDKCVFDRRRELLNTLFTNGLSMLSNEIKRSWGPEWQDAAARVNKVKENFGEKVKKLSEESEGDFNVINHGDCWSNNMMFKYNEETQTPTSVRFLDYQCLHYNSLGWDLNKLLFSAILPLQRWPNIDKLVSEYTEVLRETCGLLEFQGPLPSLQDVHRVRRRVALYGFVLSISLVPVNVSSDEKDFLLRMERICGKSDFPLDKDYSEFFRNEKSMKHLKADVEFSMKTNVI